MRLFCIVALFLCLGGIAQAQTITVIAPPPTPEGQNQDFRLVLNNPATQRLTVRVDTAPGTGAAAAIEVAQGPFDVDYTGIHQDFTFEVGRTQVTVPVPTTQDNSYEFDENFSISVRNPRLDGQAATGVTFSSPNGQPDPSGQSGNATGIIVNDDNVPTITLRQPAAVLEPDANSNPSFLNVPLAINISPIAGRPINLSLTTSDGSATSNGAGPGSNDYQPQINALFTVPAGTSQFSRNVVINGDDVYEGDEAFNVTVDFQADSNSNVLPGAASTRTIVTIIDNDLPTFDVTGNSAAEGGNIIFTVTLRDRNGGQVAALSQLTFNYTLDDITATLGSDYVNPNGGGPSGSFTLPVGAQSATLNVPTLTDNVVEGTETFRLRITSSTGTIAPVQNSAIGTITDGDAAATVAIDDSQVVEGTNGVTNMTFTVTLTAANSQQSSVSYETQTNPNVPANQQATAGTDYTPTSGRITFPPVAGAPTTANTTQTFTVPIKTDNINELNESFRVRLFNPSSNISFPGNATEIFATGTILDDDAAGTVVVAQTAVSVAENVDGRTVNVPVTFTPAGGTAAARPVTVNFTTVPGTALETGQRDYFGKSGTLTFTPGGPTTQNIPVEIIDDNISEGDENFVVRLTSADGATLGNPQQTTVTIVDNEGVPQVRVTPTTSSVIEGGSQRFTFFLLSRSQTPVTVNYSFGANGDTATNTVDYTGVDGSVTFQPGQANFQTVTFDTIEDNIAEGNEFFTLQLTQGTTNFTFEGGRNSVTGVIVDNDRAPDITLQDASVVEGNPDAANPTSALVFNGTLSRPSGQDVTFTYTTFNLKQDSCTPSVGCDVASNDDYNRQTDVPFTIPAGQTTFTFTVQVRRDTLNELDEQFAVILRAINGAVPSFNRAANRFGDRAFGTIVNDDAGGAITITAPTQTAIEDYDRGFGNIFRGRVANFSVKLPAPAGRPVTVNYVIGGGDTPAADPVADVEDLTTGSGRTGPGTGQITFFPGTTERFISLRAVRDNLDEAAENLRVGVSINDSNGANGFTVAGGIAFANTTIEDRTPGFTSVAPLIGFGAFGNTNATTLTVTGNQFVTDGNPRIFGVLFGNTEVGRGGLNIANDGNTLTVNVPRDAKTGPIRLRLSDGSFINATERASQGNFVVQPVVEFFSPARGVARVTRVRIVGRNFLDPNNPVTAVNFGGVPSNTNTAGTAIQIVSDQEILATVPTGAATGQITISSRFGLVGPPSQDTFTVLGLTPGGLRFEDTPDRNAITENSSGRFGAPVANFNGGAHRPYDLFLSPARFDDGTGNGQIIRPQQNLTVRITVVDSTTQGVDPLIQVSADTSNAGRQTQFIGPGRTIDVPIRAGYDTSVPISIAIVYAGDDATPPVFNNTVFQGPADDSTVTVSASIINSVDGNTYPNTANAPNTTPPSVQVNRFDLHGVDTDIGVDLRTDENGDDAIFPINLRNTARVSPLGVPQVRAINPDGSFNDDAVPAADVFLPLQVTKPTEGLITYYVEVPNGRGGINRVYPATAVPRDRVTVIYATDPSRDEYFGNNHVIQAVGQDDQVQDGPQTYQIQLDTTTAGQGSPGLISTDPEYKFQLSFPFTLTNADNEQGPNNTDAGFVFTKVSGAPDLPNLPRLTVVENMGQDQLSVRLRTTPTADVILNLTSASPDVVQLVDPVTNQPVNSLQLTYLVNGTPANARQIQANRAFNITVQGVNDDIRNDGGGRTGVIQTTSTSADINYNAIDPSDIIVRALDDETDGVTVSATDLTVVEGSMAGTFTVKLNSRPLANVVINVSSDNPAAATVSTSRLTFTAANFNQAQTVTVTGVQDNAFTGPRTANIVLSNTTSTDATYNNLDVPDVAVTVTDSEQAFLVTSPAGGLQTSEAGASDSFSIQLRGAPTSNVQVSFTISKPNEAHFAIQNGSTLSYTFTPTNFNSAATFVVVGQDDAVVDGDQAFVISGTVTSADPRFAGVTLAPINGTNIDNEVDPNAATTTIPANTTRGFSVPFASSTNGTVAISEAFATPRTSGATRNFEIYRFNTTGQTNNRANGDFVLVGDNERLQRGVGYRIVTGSNAVQLRVRPSGNLQVTNDASFSFNLTRNTNFAAMANNQSNAVNGYNYIGFPFNPARFTAVSFNQSVVTFNGSDRSVSDAAAAGLINPQLFTADAQGNLTPVSGDATLQPFRAYFVQIYRDNLTLTLRNPS